MLAGLGACQPPEKIVQWTSGGIEYLMFGPFGVGDSLRVYRLQRKGVALDLQQALTQPAKPLWEAWLAFVTQQAMGRPTFVLYDVRDGEGFIQVRYRPHQAAADIAFLAPALAESPSASRAWARLLDGASFEAAGRGIQRVYAGVPDQGAGTEVDVFRQTGFTPYAKEEVHRLSQPQAGRALKDLPTVRPQRPEDWPALQRLCVAITPQRVREVEGGIALNLGGERTCHRYVLPGENGNDLTAALSICVGGLAHWLHLLVHPEARYPSEDLIRWGLAVLDGGATKPVYCSVRQYESGVRPGLEACGFELYTTRTLMVKHTVAMLKMPVKDLVPSLAGGAEPVPPSLHINGERELQPSNGRLAAKREA
jgi:hypothetical protein